MLHSRLILKRYWCSQLFKIIQNQLFIDTRFLLKLNFYHNVNKLIRKQYGCSLNFYPLMSILKPFTSVMSHVRTVILTNKVGLLVYLKDLTRSNM